MSAEEEREEKRGRKRKYDADVEREVRRLLRKMSVRDVAVRVGLPKSTVHAIGRRDGVE